MSRSRIAWGFGMSAYQNSGMSRQYNYMKFDIFYLWTDKKYQRSGADYKVWAVKKI